MATRLGLDCSERSALYQRRRRRLEPTSRTGGGNLRKTDVAGSASPAAVVACRNTRYDCDRPLEGTGSEAKRLGTGKGGGRQLVRGIG